jgi:uncharacterized NAD(P)/FAD-binding protein YdhS
MVTIKKGSTVERQAFGGIVLCIGPDRNLNHRPFTRNLLASGFACRDSLGLGLAVDRSSRLIASDGHVHPTIRALGPVTRGTFGEMTGAPDILRHIVTVVEAMAAERAATITAQAPLLSFKAR